MFNMGGNFTGSAFKLDDLVEDFESDTRGECAARLKHILVLLVDDYKGTTWLDAHEYLVRWEQQVIGYNDDDLARMFLVCMLMVRAKPSHLSLA